MTEVLPCPCCGSEARICQWRDTLDPNATWVECPECGIMTDSFHHADAEEAKAMAAAVWNRRVDVNVNK
jgi:uncharacterized Zn finger protein